MICRTNTITQCGARSVLDYVQHDGGRQEAGFRGRSDCVVRAICLVTGDVYADVRRDLSYLQKKMTGGLYPSIADGVMTPVHYLYLTGKGWRLELTKNTYLPDIPRDGRFIAVIPRHVMAVCDGTVWDAWDSRFSRKTKSGYPRLLGYYCPPT
ncbi:MAG: Uncharacterised protein [Halieaceae bacterium]|nr:MAG: Uncharacterised protein [Halieaceae bacterium]